MTTVVRIGTRASDLALLQTRKVAGALAARAGVRTEIVPIQTQGDREADAPMLPGVWATGAFVSEIERSLAAGDIDLAVHSHKDLATTSLPGVVIAAIPARAAAHDVLVAATEAVAARLRGALEGAGATPDLVVGTSSPRRTAQLRRTFACRIAPLRGNVPTRVAKAGGSIDAVCLAAAGIERLGLTPPHVVVLPLDLFPTAPGQGAIAVQAREGTTGAALAALLDDPGAHRCVAAERSFLAGISAGCHAPVAASAGLDGKVVNLHVQLFRDDGSLFEERVRGEDPRALGGAAAGRALRWLGR